MTILEAQILKLQLSQDGELWYADGEENPTPATQDRSGFVRDLSSRGSLHVRVLGTYVNAPLIVDLYQRCCSPRRDGKLEVASPAVCETTAERCNPSISLCRMRQCLLSPSLGGWHQVDELDYPAYAIASQFSKDGEYTEHIERLLKTHPVYHDLTFIPTLDKTSAARLISIILDPRWFIDLRNPDRLSRLKTFLCLTPRYVNQVTKSGPDCVRTQRCYHAMRAWKGDGKEPSPADYERPENFLWRAWRSAGGGERGNLRATQRFITYFVRTWQQQLVSKSSQQLDMFQADSLFKGSEITAYKRHSAKRHV